MAAVIGSMPSIPGTATGPQQHLPPGQAWLDSEDSRMRRSASSPRLTESTNNEVLRPGRRPWITRNHSANYIESLNGTTPQVTVSRDQSPRATLRKSLSTKQGRNTLFRSKTTTSKSSEPLSLDSTVPYDSTLPGAPPRMEARSLQMSDAFAHSNYNIPRSPSPLVQNGNTKRSTSGLSELDIRTKIENAKNGIPSVAGAAKLPRPVEPKLRKIVRRSTSPSKEKRPSSGVSKLSNVSISRNSVNFSRNLSAPPSPRLATPNQSSNLPSPTVRKSLNLSTSIPQSSLQGLAKPLKPDELVRHVQFLESEYERFEEGTTTLKLLIVKQSLQPFLRDYANHPSNKELRPEDLDRRIVIFNKWWRGMLQIVSIQGERAVSLGDRQLLFLAINGIMTRPEWRVPPSDCAPIKDMYPRAVLQMDSPSSDESGSSFVADSIHHNIRNTFSANLLSQMAYVTSALSQRTASPSLVAFCGKACAYTFFFTPGVAEILIDLWQTPIQAYQRLINEFQIPLNSDFQGKFEDIVESFPRCIQPLRFTSFEATKRSRRKRRDFLLLPPSIELIDWKGPWVNRWSGRESDLFCVFVKHFHILFSEFLPPGTSDREHICAPAFLQVHAQMLVNFDQVLQRKPQAQVEVLTGPAPITFDDVLEAADTTAAALQLPFAESAKAMSENRLVLLLRDYILESSLESETSRQVFLRTFSLLLKSAVKRTSMFDQTACFTLCEFAEEALQLLLSYQHENKSSTDFIDLPFWLEVWKKMLESHNNMVAIRVITVLYAIWEPLASSEKRKEMLALDWLLAEPHFTNLFTHWCPMNRAYFMRLLCWRVARYEVEPSDMDLKIFYALSTRLRTTWATFQAYQEQLKELRKLPASTSPSNPAPGRKFLIMTTEYRPPITSIVFPFDPLNVPQPSNNSPSPPSSVSEQSGAKKSWKTIRSMIGLTNGLANNAPAPNIPPPSIHEPSLRPSPRRKDSSKSGTSRSGASDRPPACFKFSLAWLETPQNITRPRYLHPPKLGPQAEIYLRSKMSKAVTVTPVVQPEDLKAQSLKYAGRALAEWASVIGEFQGFCEKRLREDLGAEGIKVETPALTVESFKKLGLSG